MRRLKIAVVLAFTGVVALITPTPKAGSHAVVTVGSVASTSNNSLGHLASFVVTTPAAKSVTVNVNARTKLIGLSTAAVAAGLQSGDAVLASGGAGKHQVASAVRYDVAPFAIKYAQRDFEGKYASSTGPDVNGNGTLVLLNRAGKDLNFNTSAKTHYRLHGKKIATPSYTVGERISVYGQQYTDGSWLAQRVYISK